jgi:tyrosine decarboxylase / aspartate 1-decarboxylase
VQERLKQALADDLKYKDGKILSSMCSQPHPAAKWARNIFVESNLGDAGLFHGSAKLEKEVIASLIDLMHGQAEATGYIVSGGTEANMLALYAARNASQVTEPEVVVPESAHFSFDKICDMLRLKIVKARLDSEYRVDPAAVKECVNSKTVAIVGNAGSAELGAVDPIGKLSKIAASNSIPLHVDAAFGGLILPFLEDSGVKTEDFDFRSQAVQSITVDPHKMGLAPVPAGGILFRHKAQLQYIRTETPYLTESFQNTFVGTRPGASVAAVWAAFESLGREGFKQKIRKCMNLTSFLCDALDEAGFEVLVRPTINIVAFRGAKSEHLVSKLRERGWFVSYVPRFDCVRVVLMPHSTRQHIVEFLKVLRGISNP